ncbi:MAG: hypothetical protein FJY98_03660 [Candidatus Liptonbacteria bacterium]|nr:hypothetical protein [Candidatus Liptonbacteria bacterium]
MKPEKRICKECSVEFPIEADDIGFYEKFNVPAPVRCPECRLRRRAAWRNERVLYRRNCDLCGKSTVTIYSPNKPYKVYCPPCWWSDKWSALDHGQDFDFSRSFFEQFKELQLKVPRIALLTKNSVNSDYTNHAADNKNCYLSFGVFDSENVLYSTNTFPGRDSMDCYRIEYGNELMYECINAYRSYECQYSIFIWDCANCLYCYDCKGCSNCFLSSNLRNKQYHILNQPYTKEEYMEKMKEFQLSSYKEREKLYDAFLEMISSKALHRFGVIEKSNDVSGNVIFNSKNGHTMFDAERMQDSKNIIVAVDAKDTMDCYHFGFSCELLYECHALVRCYDVMFTHLSYDNSHLQYCDSCHNSENLFGCVGLKSGKYSILNKRYDEKEFATLKEKIIDHMKKTGEYGEFFPPGLSPFGYNETQGHIYMPISRKEAQGRGYKWEEVVSGTFGKETLSSEKIPDRIEDVGDSIVKEALACVQCKRNYNIIQPELELYRRFKVPIPRLCPECRYRRRLALRLPRKLWRRKCMCSGAVSENNNWKNTGKHFHGTEHCPNEFDTSYAPDRKETVFCEECYQREVA